MRRLLGVCALLFACSAVELRAQDCRSITPIGPCVFRDSRPVVFGPASVPRIAAAPRAPETTKAPHPHTALLAAPAGTLPAAQPPIDCAMVKEPPATHDRFAVKLSPPGVTPAARVITVPPCRK